eukprot:1340336-Prymnesium_polylepis.1
MHQGAPATRPRPHAAPGRPLYSFGGNGATPVTSAETQMPAKMIAKVPAFCAVRKNERRGEPV